MTFLDGRMTLLQFPVNPSVLLLQAAGSLHLDREAAREMLHVLRHFIRTGRLGVDGFEDAYYLGAYVKGVHPETRGVRGVLSQFGPEFFYIRDLDKGTPEEPFEWIMGGRETLEERWEPCDPPTDVLTWHERLLKD